MPKITQKTFSPDSKISWKWKKEGKITSWKSEKRTLKEPHFFSYQVLKYKYQINIICVPLADQRGLVRYLKCGVSRWPWCRWCQQKHQTVQFDAQHPQPMRPPAHIDTAENKYESSTSFFSPQNGENFMKKNFTSRRLIRLFSFALTIEQTSLFSSRETSKIATDACCPKNLSSNSCKISKNTR